MAKFSAAAPVAASAEQGFARLHQRFTDNGFLARALSSRVDPPRTISVVQVIGKNQKQTVVFEIVPAGPGSSTLSLTSEIPQSGGEALGGWLATKALKKKHLASLASFVAIAEGSA
ncbi:MAG: hypothetical protein M3140_06245 [Actinomycetota bacterium]|nr:hypothetical protein [Actinomycetota bacterium]